MTLTADASTLKMKSDGPPAVREGDAVHVAFAPAAAHLFDPGDGARL